MRGSNRRAHDAGDMSSDGIQPTRPRKFSRRAQCRWGSSGCAQCGWLKGRSIQPTRAIHLRGTTKEGTRAGRRLIWSKLLRWDLKAAMILQFLRPFMVGDVPILSATEGYMYVYIFFLPYHSSLTLFTPASHLSARCSGRFYLNFFQFMYDSMLHQPNTRMYMYICFLPSRTISISTLLRLVSIYFFPIHVWFLLSPNKYIVLISSQS